MSDAPNLPAAQDVDRRDAKISKYLGIACIGAGAVAAALGTGPLGFFVGYTVGRRFMKSAKMSEFFTRDRKTPTQEQRERFSRIVDEVSAGEGIASPRVRLVGNDMAMAAAGRMIRSKKGVVIGFTGALDAMDDAELRGVVAHEMRHFQNADSRGGLVAKSLTDVVGGIRGYIPFVAAWSVASAWSLAPSLLFKAAVAAGAAMLSVHYLIWVGASGAAWTTRSALMRFMERRADREAGEKTRDPMAIARGIHTLEAHNETVKTPEAQMTTILNRVVGISSRRPSVLQRAVAAPFIDHPFTADREKSLRKVAARISSQPPASPDTGRAGLS